jgi:glycerol uptake facilitator-like aquaporin
MTYSVMPGPETCFFEQDPDMAVHRRAASEAVGTLLLMLAATGSGLAARHLLPDNAAFGLLASAFATAGALVGLILAFGSASGGHFNPLISGLQWLAGERKLNCTLAYVVAQIFGAITGALLANVTFGLSQRLTDPPPSNWTYVLSEMLATTGLMIIVFGCARSGRTETGPFAVGAWLVAAIIAMPSTSYANPALTLAALFADGPIALSPPTVAFYLLAQLAGALLALLIITVTYPFRRGGRSDRHREKTEDQIPSELSLSDQTQLLGSSTRQERR